MTRPTTPIVWLSALCLALALAVPTRAGVMKTVYVGTYTDGGASEGIYRFDFDPTTGSPGPAHLAAKTKNPSFLALTPNGRFLYTVNEVNTFEGEPGGAVSGFAVDPKSGDLTALNEQSTWGAGPCYLVIDKAGRHVLVANYGGGSVLVLPIDPEGRIGDRTSFFQHMGSSVNPTRQKEPHAHSINLDPANRFAFAADLGLDQVLVYHYTAAKGKLVPNNPFAAAVAPGAGPRHFDFHPSGKFAYAIDELNSTVTAWTYDPERGVLSDLQTITTLPDDFKGPNSPADLHVHPSGRFLYGSNRGHDSIVAYAIDPKSGKLTLIGHQGQAIKNPRNFALTPNGRFLLVANQDLNTIVIFRIEDDGKLVPTGNSVKVPKPVCVKFATQAG